MESSYFSEYYVRGNSGKTMRYHGFDKIDNSTDAYMIGYMAMDGSFLNINSKSIHPRMGLTSITEYVVKYFRDNYSPDSYYANRGKRSSKKVNSTHDSYEMLFSSKMSDTFKRFGILDYKPNRIMVNIPKRYFFSYLHGVMDADGCWCIRHRSDCRYDRLQFSIGSSALKILQSIQHTLLENCISSSLYLKSGGDKCYGLRVDNVQTAIYLGKLIYNTKVGLPKVYNYTKYKIYCDYIKENYQFILGADKRMNCWKAFEENDNQQLSS